ncbi:MmoB/DmpM family protein [Pseudomonas kurunegalensis]|nr:MmoB/DmpM family protein [Pseudomonas kurunegalensis]MCA4075471.1 MmoB/DmpM family protein [Pseudomonas kurunegalensis]
MVLHLGMRVVLGDGLDDVAGAVVVLEIHRATVEEKIGREWDVQEMLIDVITLGGNVEEDEDCFALHWN